MHGNGLLAYLGPGCPFVIRLDTSPKFLRRFLNTEVLMRGLAAQYLYEWQENGTLPQIEGILLARG